ncbi:uncharacterized protein C19orf44 homolog isoform X2 [Mugil cephalus]|uniref:uncharacterized protein C19orf44 homolog isoform X2 n=1 Tax=Mugil cephalus TaxID=48193 RepID=UPI001FB65BFD|nr:uncharacterized protein C19orf44 homolog isoform X2 [Mugil cephalus]
MWKRGGRSSALDRAQALLSAKRSSGGDVRDSTDKTQGSVGGPVQSRSAPANTHTLFSDLSDMSSVSSASERDADAVKPVNSGKTHVREEDSSQELKPQGPLGRGSRFLKKAPPPIKSSQSPVSRSQIPRDPEPRYVTSSQRGSQNAALSRLAEIESRIRSRKQAQAQARHQLTPDLRISPLPPATQSMEAPVQLSTQSTQSGSDQSPKGNRFLKNKVSGAVESTNAAPAPPPKSAVADVRSGPRTGQSVVPSKDTRSVRVTRAVSLESDEEDMRILLGDSMGSTDHSFLRPGRSAFMKKPEKVLSETSQRIHSSSPPPAAVVRASSSCNSEPSRSPASPSRRSSPFRFTGQARAHFSPSALSPSPSPPHVSPSPLGRQGYSSDRARSPQRSLSSMSGRGEVLSLEELFPAAPGSESQHSVMSSVYSEEQQDFKINVMTLDDLVPATLGLTGETVGEERENRCQQLPKEGKQEEEEEETVLDYKSDFESESRVESDYSASHVSEHLKGDGDEEEVVSEVREEAPYSDVSHEWTKEDYSSAFAGTSDESQTSGSFSRNRSRDSRSSVSRSREKSSPQSRRRVSARKSLKEAAVQTQPDPLAYSRSTGAATLGPAVSMTYMKTSPLVTHTVSAEMVEAIGTFSPAMSTLTEMLKQQLAMTRRFIDSNRHLHSRLVQSLEPPDYRYTTLEATKERIRKHRPAKLTMEQALEEVLQEMRLYTGADTPLIQGAQTVLEK